jgi:class 3 adenylate cyclase/rubredoxin
MSLKSKEYFKKIELPISQTNLWDLLSNTDHLNRTLGLPIVEYDLPFIDPSNLYRIASTKALGVELQWKENFFEWVKPDYYSVLREFDKGPFTSFQSVIKLIPTEKGTILDVALSIKYKEIWAGPLAVTVQNKGINDLIAYCNSYYKLIQENQFHQLPTKHPSNVNKSTLEKYIKNLKLKTPIDSLLIENLKNHLINASDESVIHMRAFTIADSWGTNRRETLKLFLYATCEGLLNLKWELICPNCRVSKEEFNTLKEMSSNFHCDLCGIDYEADLDRYTEARFSVNQDVRFAKNDIYCIGSPSNFPHILAQQYIKPNEKRTLSICLEDKPIRIRTIKYNQISALSPTKNHSTNVIDLTYTKEGWVSKEQAFKPGQNTISIHNNTNQVIVYVIEKVEWDDQIASAFYISTMQEFRSLFGSEVLSKNTQISIQNLYVLFTDLKKSTLLYESIGDAPAYGQVRKHFDFLANLISINNGSIVKTIGDAVMAVFPSKIDVLSAAIAIQSQINEFNKINKLNPHITIKLGIHSGPAIAVNANEVLDYFGRTINIASRIQKESEGGDIIVLKEILDDAEIEQMLKKHKLEITDLEARLKDIEGTFKLCRIVPKTVASF